MNAIVNWILAIPLLLFQPTTTSEPGSSEYSLSYTHTINPTDSIETNAFSILESKCNFCHKKWNRKRIFTRENMNGWANDVHTQVFVKKRMPRGRKNKLNDKEYQHLLTWINSTKNQE